MQDALATLSGSKPLLDYATARERFDELRLKHQRLLGVHEAAVRKQKETTEQVALAKGRKELDGEIMAVFQEMQHRAHMRSVGVFENLLSAIVQDMFPGKGRVAMDLGTERGSAALDIFIKCGEIREDILEGNGGALNNVVILGLRFSSLLRTENRRFMALDEPDCWIKPDRIENFVKVISDVTQQSGAQTLIISHHDQSYFEGKANIIRLYSDNGTTKSTVLEPRVSEWADDATPGIRYIRAIGVRAHEDTTIHVGPGMNAIIGDNDLGKSTLVTTTMRAVAYGESDESILRHVPDPDNINEETGEPARRYVDEAKIIIGLENQKRVEWTRKLKGSPVVMYRLYQGDELLNEGRPAKKGAVPEWVSEALGIKKVEGLDIQLGNQKSPIFLLDETPSVRAQLLSVGKESGHLNSMQDAYRLMKSDDQATIRTGEAELTRLKWMLPTTERLVPMAATFSILNALAKELDNATKHEKMLVRLIASIEESKRKADLCALKRDLLLKLPEVPVLHDNARLASIAGKIKAHQARAALTLPALEVAVPAMHDNARLLSLTAKIESSSKKAAVTLPELKVVVPELTDNRRLLEVGRKLAELKAKSERVVSLPELKVAAPELPRTDMLLRQLQQMERLATLQKQLEEQEKLAAAELAEESARYDALKEELGECPLCGGALPEGGLAHAH